MTEAEKALIDALVSAKDLRINSAGFDAADIHSAVRLVALERVPPEAKEKFQALRARYNQAEKELHAFTSSLPPDIVMQWWDEKL